jgi:stage II sporulation protein D
MTVAHVRCTFVFAAATVAAGCVTPASVDPSPRPTGRVPTLGVALSVGAERVVLGSQGAGRITAPDGSRFRLDRGRSVAITASEGRVRFDGDDDGRSYERLVFESSESTRYLTVDGAPYRGTLEVHANGGAVTAINRIGIEDYLLGVVPTELGTRDERDRAALRAQAVASRTYALKNRGRFAAEGYDLRASVADQVYAGVSRETELGSRSVRDTRGQVLTFGGQLIAAFFHSTCGPTTASPEEAFRSVRPQAYLRPVSDHHGEGYYSEISPRFSWTVTWDRDTLDRILRRTLPAVVGIDVGQVDEVRDVRVRGTGPSGRVTEVRIVVGAGEIPVFGPDLRRVFLTPEGQPLGSNAVRFDTQHRDGRLERLTASGFGWGHGVGFCQWGAIGRSRAGHDYDAILTTYYPGAKIERWY